MPATLYGFEPFMIPTLRLCRLSLTFHSHQAHNAARLPGLKPKTAPATFADYISFLEGAAHERGLIRVLARS